MKTRKETGKIFGHILIHDDDETNQPPLLPPGTKEPSAPVEHEETGEQEPLIAPYPKSK